MSKTLGGFMFVKSGITYDYCFEESILSMLEFCDEVSVLVIDSEDNTVSVVHQLSEEHPKLKVDTLPESAWDEQKGTGKLKLSYFQNLAAKNLTTDYQFLLQADEILHEDSYQFIRAAMDIGQDGYLCSRINLWKTPYLQLNVPQDRKPCSTEVIRLTKCGYETYDDGENIAAPTSPDFTQFIRIYHMGFVRRKEVMKSKIINMQCNAFEMENYDHKLDMGDIFNPDLWFNPETDLIPIAESLPLLIQNWAEDRA